jgi:8-oxo-dGTP pyrophosphatase MutT (NUDIX family)
VSSAPPLGRSAITRQRLRAIMAGRRARSVDGPSGALAAAVVLPITFDEGVNLVVVVRAAHLRDHGGEVGFPGGKPEPSDPDLRATALREMEEEVGVSPGSVEVVGTLTPVPVISGRYLIHPFVALADEGARFRVASAEVERVIEVPLLPWILGERPTHAVRAPYRGKDVLFPHFEVSSAGEPRTVLYGASAYIAHELLTAIAEDLGVALPMPQIEASFPWGDRYSR